jgi:hypothetical protein
MSTSITSDLIEQIRDAHNKANGTARKALEHAAECGRLLIKAKEELGKHGSWMYWVKQHAGMSHRTANGYMKLAANWHRVANLRGGIRDTLKLLAMAETPPEEPAPAPTAPVPSAKESRLTNKVVVDAEIVEPEAQGVSDVEPLVIDGTKDESQQQSDPTPKCKVTISLGMAIWENAKAILDTIIKSDKERVQALTACADYCNSRIANNK